MHDAIGTSTLHLQIPDTHTYSYFMLRNLEILLYMKVLGHWNCKHGLPLTARMSRRSAARKFHYFTVFSLFCVVSLQELDVIV